MSDTIAGRYTLIDPIARGGSGTVWRAWDQRRRKLCAAKVLRQRDSADLLRFVREQSVKLEHPHVLAPYGWAAEDEHVVIAMDLCDGGTLETALQDHGALSDEVVEEVMLQLLRALHFVHAEGWIHRDVKPANLMMNATGMGRPLARLADFGIATQVEDARLTRIGTVVGTPGYIAPELLEGADPDPAQDLFAAGVVAMRMVQPNHGRGQSPTPDMALAAFGEDSLLGAEIAALLDPDPAVRHDGALALQERLAAESEDRRFDPARTRDGEVLEIFQALDPLPTEWQEIVEGSRQPPEQPTTGAVTAARSGDAGDSGAASAAASTTTTTGPGLDVPSGGWVRTNYGMVSTPPPGGEPVVGPAAGPAGAALHGMPSGLTGEGDVAPATAPPTSGPTTGSVVQGPLPQGQESRATLLGGAVAQGWNSPMPGTASQPRRDLSHLSVDDPTDTSLDAPPTYLPNAGPVRHSGYPNTGATSSAQPFVPMGRPVSPPGARRSGPLARFGIAGAAGWVLIGLLALVLVTAVVLGVILLNGTGGEPDPPPTNTPAPTSTQETPFTEQTDDSDNGEATIGPGFSGDGPGSIGG